MKVGIISPYNWPLLRQIPGGSGRWGKYHFFLNQNINECDALVVLNSLGKRQEKMIVHPNLIFLFAPEPYPVQQYHSKFIQQFSVVITPQEEIRHKGKVISQPGAPWFVNKSYDELKNMAPVKKNKKISVITSNKLITDGHKRRFEFVMKLKESLGENIDLFGRGINDFDDKWDVLAPYQYNICIENGSHDHYFTEKLTDCYLSYTFPIYHGCPNLNRYFSEESFKHINILKFDEALKEIEVLLNKEEHYSSKIPLLYEARKKCLDKYNFFQLIAECLDQTKVVGTKQQVTLRNKFFDPGTILEKMIYRVKIKKYNFFCAI